MAETIIHKSKTKKDTQGNLATETSETRIKNKQQKQVRQESRIERKRISLCYCM